MNLFAELIRTLREYRRVISISKKPSKTEFVSILKICGLGIVVMGAIGFIIQIVYQLLLTAVM